ncbi:MFS transporter [Pseudahrensia aquimaris]|uniref:MFS transporter n=1 Tax=Pseudahrensia aquimaris TaxID=744461 RepID=A0ABW3FI63_9HYPH
MTLNLPRLIAYGLPAISLAALTLPLYVVVPTFYAESLKLPVEAIGLTLLFVRLFDAVNDPLIGWLSDRWRPAWGRRKVWFTAFVPIALLGAWNLFWPPADAGLWHLGVWSLVLSLGYTGAILPYTAWGAELDTSYEGRSRVAAVREGLILVGTLVAIAVPFTLGWSDPAAFHGLALLAVGIALTLPVFVTITLFFVPEPRERSRTRVNLSDGLGHMIRNAPFVRLVSAFLLNGLGNAIAATLFLLYVSERLGLGDQRGAFLFVYFLAGVIGVPFWNWLAKRTSKHRAWCIAMIFAIVVFSPAPFLPEGSIYGFGAICVLSGLALGADLTLPPAIQADVIDVDTARSGEQRSGTYFAAWSLTTKLALALAVGIAFPVLGVFGFDPAQDAQSTAIGITLLGFFYGWGPIALKIPAVAMMWNFPLTREDVDRLSDEIDAAQRAV